MDICFSQFCHDQGLCASLQRYVDACGERGQSYEFPHCQMPEGCIPAYAVLGFYRREDGSYVMYWRPLVAYRGKSRVLELLFRQCIWRFNTFDLLTARLRSLRREIPASPPLASPLPLPRQNTNLFSALVQGPQRPTKTPWPELYQTLYRTLSGRVFGQETAVEAAAFRLFGHIGKTAPARPLSMVFYGPTGVGKSALGKAIAPALKQCGSEAWQFVWTELNTFTQPHAVHRLIGAPPGYVGYEDEPVFAAVRRNPRTVFMFDELDKAHPDVLKVFMSILDEGRCTANRAGQDGQRELDFRKCIFLFTTNLDLSSTAGRSLGFTAQPCDGAAVSNTKAASPEELAERLFVQNEIARNAMVQHGVLQEIAGRFSGFIEFQRLTDTAQLQIITRQAMSLGAEYGLQIVHVTRAAAKKLLPDKAVFSMRSAICMLDAKLAPIYQQAAGSRDGCRSYQLVETSGILVLSAVPSVAGDESSPAAS